MFFFCCVLVQGREHLDIFDDDICCRIFEVLAFKFQCDGRLTMGTTLHKREHELATKILETPMTGHTKPGNILLVRGHCVL